MSSTAPANPPNELKLQANPEETLLNLLVETLESLDKGVRGQFLQKFLRSLAQVELSEPLSLECWDQVLARRKELSESLGKPVSLQTAMVDVLAAANLLRMPILMEYEELKKLQINAATDALTGLYNRRLFEEYFTKELNRAKRYSQHLAIILVDLHRFKDVNDQHGHQQGDQVLQAAAATLRKTLRTSDYAFRIGGDEFAVILPQADPEQADILGRRLRTNYEAAIQPMKLNLSLAMDYGLSVHPEDGDEEVTLIRVADQRLYQFKNSMRGQPRVIAMESLPREEAAASPAGKPAAKAKPAAREDEETANANRRRWERVSMAGTTAYAVLSEADRTARVVDLSYGGVGLQVERPDEVPGQFQAVLHVPILPPVKVNLRKMNVQSAKSNHSRIGCAFSS